MQATYAKLRDGSWGVRCVLDGDRPPQVGEVVTVTRKDGQKRAETIAQVIWVGDDRDGNEVALCSTRNGASDTRTAEGGSATGRPAVQRRSHGGDQVVCRHCGEWTAEGDDWCMICGKADYER
jgi:hypothetical protein